MDTAVHYSQNDSIISSDLDNSYGNKDIEANC